MIAIFKSTEDSSLKVTQRTSIDPMKTFIPRLGDTVMLRPEGETINFAPFQVVDVRWQASKRIAAEVFFFVKSI